MRPIVADPADQSSRLLLLDEGVKTTGADTLSSASVVHHTAVRSVTVCHAGLNGLREDLQDLVRQRQYQVVQYQVHLEYSHFSADQILKVRHTRLCCMLRCQLWSQAGWCPLDSHKSLKDAQALLPDGMEVPSAFEGIGHIAHLNLKDEWLPYKHIIGEVRIEPCA